MKNVINFYYQMNIENIHLVKGIYYCTYQNDSYLFVPFYKNIQNLPHLYQLNQRLIGTNPYYYQIMLTRDKTPYVFIDQVCYCLLKASRVVHDEMSFFDLPLDSILVDSTVEPLIRFSWRDFWIQKLDYYEELLLHLENTSRKILPIFLYYMGMAENAIQYIYSVTEKITKTRKDKLVVCHHRVDAKWSVANLYFPLDLVIDYPARDISEYLKSLFYYNDYDLKEIEEYLLNLDFSDFGYSLLFGRMLYPSFFFDTCDRVFQGSLKENELFLLGERREEYRIFLKEIYYIIRKRVYLEEVRWILRN